MSILLKADNISYHAEKGEEILKDISFELKGGEILGIAGESGSGKTTLGKIIAGLITPTSGKIIFNGPADREKSRVSSIQILFQNNGEILNPLRRIDSVVKEALKLGKDDGRSADKEAEELFRSLGLSKELGSRRGYELSGGEQQRAALARILAVNPVLIILDEPFSAQDPDSQNNFLNLFKKINKEMGITLICISHNLRILRELCDNVLIIYRGSIVESGECGEIFSSPKHPYTKFLFKADSYKLTYDEFNQDLLNTSGNN
jgi:ABC-type dipeptide/oligopeptide/nickel transport system ATPase subunit